MGSDWVPGVPDRPYWLERLRGWWRRTGGILLGLLIAALDWLGRHLRR